MKKLFYTIIIPLTMVCCQSEESQMELANFELSSEVNCLYARIDLEGHATVHDHWRNTATMDGYKKTLPSGVKNEFYCFNVDEYTKVEMEEIIKSKN